MIERGSWVPSSIPRRCDSDPAATLRTTTSSGTISTSRISCRACEAADEVGGHPDIVEVLKQYSEIRLLRRLALDYLVFLGI